jgi:hypothetical protein
MAKRLTYSCVTILVTHFTVLIFAPRLLASNGSPNGLPPRVPDPRSIPDTFGTVCQIRGDELDDAGTYELVHRIRGKATPDELDLGSFTSRKIKQLPIWDLRLA